MKRNDSKSENVFGENYQNIIGKDNEQESKLDDSEEDVYEVEKILNKKRFGKEWKYKIKWVGYPDDQCTWEPKDNLHNEMLKDFEREFSLKEKNKANISLDSSSEKIFKKNKKRLKNDSRKKVSKLICREKVSNYSGLDINESRSKEKENNDKDIILVRSMYKEVSERINVSEDLPSKIVSVLPGEASNEIKCLIEWKTRENGQKPPNSLLSNKILRKQYPDLLFDFYEARINFRDKK